MAQAGPISRSINWLIVRLIVILIVDCGSWSITCKIKDSCKRSTLVCYSPMICKIAPKPSLTAAWSNTPWNLMNYIFLVTTSSTVLIISSNDWLAIKRAYSMEVCTNGFYSSPRMAVPSPVRRNAGGGGEGTATLRLFLFTSCDASKKKL